MCFPIKFFIAFQPEIMDTTVARSCPLNRCTLFQKYCYRISKEILIFIKMKLFIYYDK